MNALPKWYRSIRIIFIVYKEKLLARNSKIPIMLVLFNLKLTRRSKRLNKIFIRNRKIGLRKEIIKELKVLS